MMFYSIDSLGESKTAYLPLLQTNHDTYFRYPTYQNGLWTLNSLVMSPKAKNISQLHVNYWWWKLLETCILMQDKVHRYMQHPVGPYRSAILPKLLKTWQFCCITWPDSVKRQVFWSTPYTYVVLQTCIIIYKELVEIIVSAHLWDILKVLKWLFIVYA